MIELKKVQQQIHLKRLNFLNQKRNQMIVLAKMEKVSQFVGESLPVVNEENDLLGTVTEGDLFQAVIDVQRNARSMER